MQLQCTVQVVRWTQSKSCYTIHEVVEVFPFGEVSSLVHGLIDASAFHNNAESSGFRVAPHQHRVLAAMHERGFVSQRNAGTLSPWYFTEKGISVVGNCSILSQRQPVFQVREDIPLGNLTEYEVLAKLEDGGWVWNLWLPPSARRRLNHEETIGTPPCIIY